MMSIPRDTLAEVPGRRHADDQLRLRRAAAPPCWWRPSRALTGIHIDHYVELGFGSVINTVDAFGGVEICPKQDMKDPLARLDIKKGCQEVDGLTALAYSRSRYVTALSDLDRVARQREVISALGDEALVAVDLRQPGALLEPQQGRVGRHPDRRGDEPGRPRAASPSR